MERPVTRTRVSVVIAIVGLAVSAVSLGGLTVRNAQAQQPQASPPKAAHGDHEHPSVPAAYAKAHIPPQVWTDPNMIARGKEIFVAKCALCHGEKGDGKGPGSANLPLKPADVSDGKMV